MKAAADPARRRRDVVQPGDPARLRPERSGRPALPAPPTARSWSASTATAASRSLGGASRLKRLPQVIGEAEGIAQIGATIYIADQLHNRVVALTASGVRTVLQLQPDRKRREPRRDRRQLAASSIVPDSPHGTVLMVDPSGRVAARWAGFSRPGGVGPRTAAIPDRRRERQRHVRAEERRRFTTVAGNLAGADDVVRDARGSRASHPARAGHPARRHAPAANIATGLRNPQGLDFDGAQNLLVTESDNGRVDLIVRTFALTRAAAGRAPAAGAGGVLGNYEGSGIRGRPERRPDHGRHRHPGSPAPPSSFEVLPEPCAAAVCTVSLHRHQPGRARVRVLHLPGLARPISGVSQVQTMDERNPIPPQGGDSHPATAPADVPGDVGHPAAVAVPLLARARRRDATTGLLGGLGALLVAALGLRQVRPADPAQDPGLLARCSALVSFGGLRAVLRPVVRRRPRGDALRPRDGPRRGDPAPGNAAPPRRSSSRSWVPPSSSARTRPTP